MKEDSLLSNLSNLSYHGNNQSVDFFNDSSLAGAYSEIKVKQPADQEEVNLNELPIFSMPHNENPSPKRNGLLLAYWNDHNNILDGHSDMGDSHIEEPDHIELQPEHVVKVQPQLDLPRVKIENPVVKLQPQRSDLSYSGESAVQDQIGTVIKNETKNIPKNYGKAIITYIEREHENFKNVLEANGIEYEELLSQLSKKKKYINTIANLRELWVDFKYAKCMRMLSNQFLRKYALQYIFNSRICNYTSHVKYRKRLQQAIQAPNTFRHIKQY